jgi:hypothetical protein
VKEMKRTFIFLLVCGILIVMPLLSSCESTPSGKVVQTAIAQIVLVRTSTPSIDIEKQQLISEVIPLLEKGTSEAYAEAWNKLRLVGNYHGKYWNDEEIQALLWFSYDMINVASGRIYPDNFSFISPDYGGVYHEQISTEVLKHINREEWVTRYQTNSPMLVTVIAKYRQPLP